MAKSLLTKGEFLVYLFVNENKELQVAIDTTHEPWSIMAHKLLTFIKTEMAEVGYEFEDIDEDLTFLGTSDHKLQ